MFFRPQARAYSNREGRKSCPETLKLLFALFFGPVFKLSANSETHPDVWEEIVGSSHGRKLVSFIGEKKTKKKRSGL